MKKLSNKHQGSQQMKYEKKRGDKRKTETFFTEGREGEELRGMPPESRRSNRNPSQRKESLK